MTQEEKSKAYDEAIKKAEVLYKTAEPMSGCNVLLETVFPELAESEDEKIRKWLVELVEEVRKANPTNVEHNGMCSEALAWIEKQAEQKPTWSEEDERHIDTITSLLKDRKKEQSDWGIEVLNEEIAWLKSLRPQSQWKPSVFHLECIEDAISLYEKHGINAIGLKEILDELKKLKE